MRLAQLKRTWNTLSTSEKTAIIEESNRNRIRAFEIEIEKKESKARKKASKSTRKKSVPAKAKTPEGLLSLMEKMSPEEKENFMLMVNSTKKS